MANGPAVETMAGIGVVVAVGHRSPAGAERMHCVAPGGRPPAAGVRCGMVVVLRPALASGPTGNLPLAAVF